VLIIEGEIRAAGAGYAGYGHDIGHSKSLGPARSVPDWQRSFLMVEKMKKSQGGLKTWAEDEK